MGNKKIKDDETVYIKLFNDGFSDLIKCFFLFPFVQLDCPYKVYKRGKLKIVRGHKYQDVHQV